MTSKDHSQSGGAGSTVSSKIETQLKDSDLDKLRIEDFLKKLGAERITPQVLANIKSCLGIKETDKLKEKDLDRLTKERLEKFLKIEKPPELEVELYARSLRQLQYMIICDSVHGPIEFHPLIIAIMDTPEFQRLKNIKQLGGGHFVYPSAVHTRFDHSIGVCYLAGELALTLQRKQPECRITDTDVLCVQIAGLCHDLGHGPFSRVFDLYLFPELGFSEPWEHGKVSQLIFDKMCDSPRLREAFKRYGLEDKDKQFIAEQLDGSSKEGRGREKHFLYQIVANRRNGIDVDKWDYFARDCHHTGTKNSFLWRRCTLVVRAAKDDGGEWQLCVRDKDMGNIFGMFQMRTNLRKQVYYHKTKIIAERMIADSLSLVKEEEIFSVPNSGTMLSIHGAVKRVLCDKDPSHFLALTDDVLQQITHYVSPNPDDDGNIQEAKRLIERLNSHQLYRYIGVTAISDEAPIMLEIKDKLTKASTRRKIAKQIAKCGDIVNKVDHIIVELVPFPYGSDSGSSSGAQSSSATTEGNPVRMVCFYTKNDPWTVRTPQKEQISSLDMPQKFSETEIRVYNKATEEDELEDDTVRVSFEKWCSKYLGMELAQSGSVLRSKYCYPPTASATPTRERSKSY